jgi:ribonuclease T1
MRTATLLRSCLAVIIAIAAWGPFTLAIGKAKPEATASIAALDLPAEARETLECIYRGGPFRFERDGIAFGNREHLLPPKPRGYYHEYTVPTPGSRSRGARRIVCGGRAPSPEICYYSDDHYQSFRRIAE